MRTLEKTVENADCVYTLWITLGRMVCVMLMAHLLPFAFSEKSHEVTECHALWSVSFTDFVWREGKCVSGAADELCHSSTSCGGRGNACLGRVTNCVIHRLRVEKGDEAAPG